jgi:hypothetical protein
MRWLPRTAMPDRTSVSTLLLSSVNKCIALNLLKGGHALPVFSDGGQTG